MRRQVGPTDGRMSLPPPHPPSGGPRRSRICQRFFQRHGPWVVFVFRFTPVFRTMISLPAGLAHMGVGRFLVFTFAGAFIWNLLLVEGGRRLALWLADSQEVLG